MRFVLLLVALAAVACGGPTTATPSAEPPQPLTVALADFEISPDALTLTGTTVSIDVSNAGPTPHNLSIRGATDEILLATPNLRTGESATLDGQLSAGEYVIFCSLAGHESLGMRGTLSVGD
jgi:plastocyanin